jgi:hypothetical protein
VAGRLSRPADLALCPPAGQGGAPRLPSGRAPSGGVAADRVAARGEGADEVLALDPAGGHRLRSSRPLSQAALAHRARLPRAQTGTRARALRGPGLARFPSPRHPVHRRLRVPGCRAGDDSPLRMAQSPPTRDVWPSRRLSTTRRPQSGRSATWRTPSQACGGGLRQPWLAALSDVPAASAGTHSQPAHM